VCRGSHTLPLLISSNPLNIWRLVARLRIVLQHPFSLLPFCIVLIFGQLQSRLTLKKLTGWLPVGPPFWAHVAIRGRFTAPFHSPAYTSSTAVSLRSGCCAETNRDRPMEVGRSISPISRHAGRRRTGHTGLTPPPPPTSKPAPPPRRRHRCSPAGIEAFKHSSIQGPSQSHP
jgi:hypothetical protein